MVLCGYTRDAIARVFSISDGALLHLLKCVPEGTRLGFGPFVAQCSVLLNPGPVFFLTQVQQADCHSGNPGWSSFNQIYFHKMIICSNQIIIYVQIDHIDFLSNSECDLQQHMGYFGEVGDENDKYF